MLHHCRGCIGKGVLDKRFNVIDSVLWKRQSKARLEDGNHEKQINYCAVGAVC